MGQTSWTRDYSTEERIINADGTLREEIGHAYDEAAGWVSHSPEFRAAYDADIAALSQEDMIFYDYLTQSDDEGSAGAEETFAAMFAIHHGGWVYEPSVIHDIVNRCFPQSAEFVRKYLRDVEEQEQR